MKKVKLRVLLFMLMLSLLTAGNIPAAAPVSAANSSLKVLAIGNSFSENALTYLYQLASTAGYGEVKLGNLYIAGCSLQTHWNNANNNIAGYSYNTNYDGTWKSKPSTSILTALQSEKWDYIIFQQVSTYSGMSDSFEPYLGNLINYVDANKTNPDAKFAWHMTWAYAKTSTHEGFKNYNNDQDAMYSAIINASRTAVMQKYSSKIDLLIPSGTTIQNLRSSYIQDNDMTADGYHLSQKLGCLAAGMTWLRAFSGSSIDNITTSVVSENYLKVVKESVNNAFTTPYTVTKSKFVTDPAAEFNPANYDLLNWEPTAYSYWNATSTDKLYTAPTVELNKRFIASGRKFSKQDIPVGSVIMIDAGYQYRAEKWPESGLATTAREPNTSERLTFVTDTWWGNWAYVTFNLSKIDSTLISDNANVHSPALKIYIPKATTEKSAYSGSVNVPELESKTENSVTLKKVTGYEYSMDAQNWQKSNIFNGLTTGTEYSFYCRVAETDTVLASNASSAIKVTLTQSTVSEVSDTSEVSTVSDVSTVSNVSTVSTDEESIPVTGDKGMYAYIIAGFVIVLAGIVFGTTKLRKAK